MKGIRRINTNPAEQTLANYMAATNAYADQLRLNGEPTEYLSAQNARTTLAKIIKSAMAFANPAHEKHNQAFNALKTSLGGSREAMDYLHTLGERYIGDTMKLATAAMKNGMGPEQATDFALNSLAGNPVYDHFGNLNLLAGQLYEEQAFVEAFQDAGDAFAVPVEAGGTGLDKSRFRAPVEQVSGSAKIMQGDINPRGMIQDDNNRTSISLYNEFKNAITLDSVFSITQAMRDQALGYEKAISPALAGFILQNRYFGAAQKQVMKLAELMFAFGLDEAGTYTPNVGGSYGVLSSAIRLQLSDWNANVPSVATGTDWAPNPTKLLQVIQNAYYKPTNVAAPLDVSVDPSLMYKEIVRLFVLAAQQNVNFQPAKWAVFVPSSWYGLAMQYPGTADSSGTGTFNKQLQEMVKSATDGRIIPNIEVIPSSLMNYGAQDGFGGSNSYNYIAVVAMGCPQEKKPIIMPGQTAIPTIVSDNVSATIMNFRAQYLFGGPMFMQYGGAFLLEISAQAT